MCTVHIIIASFVVGIDYVGCGGVVVRVLSPMNRKDMVVDIRNF